MSSMGTKININVLSSKSINDAIKQLEAYRDSLDYKVEVFTQRLAEVGLQTAQTHIDESPLGKNVAVELQMDVLGTTKYKKVAKIIATGAVNEVKDREPFSIVLAIEFGAGIHYNSGKKNKYADLLGYGVGTYPGQIHAFEDTWFYWDEKAQEWRPTHGVKATMPMYNAITEMVAQYKDIAREVFGK